MSEKYKKTCKYLNFVENLLILFSAITACVSISAFDSLVYFLLVLRVLQLARKRIKKKKKKHDKTVLRRIR